MKPAPPRAWIIELHDVRAGKAVRMTAIPPPGTTREEMLYAAMLKFGKDRVKDVKSSHPS